MKIVDVTLFNNEYDLLELRLEIMSDYVDEFVIVECDQTHTSEYKGFNLEKNWGRFSRWHHKINYIKSENVLNHSYSWHNEYAHRDQMNLGLGNINDDDVFLISDCDEIIRPETIQYVKDTDYDHYRFLSPMFYFKFNYLKSDSEYTVWSRAYRGKYRNIAASHFRYDRNPWELNSQPSMNSGPNMVDNFVVVPHAGWHFSWLGDDEFVKNKLKNFAHTEFNNSYILDDLNIDRYISQGVDHLKRGGQSTGYVSVKLDDYFPKPLIENKEKYAKYLLPDGDKSVYDYFPK